MIVKNREKTVIEELLDVAIDILKNNCNRQICPYFVTDRNLTEPRYCAFTKHCAQVSADDIGTALARRSEKQHNKKG